MRTIKAKRGTVALDMDTDSNVKPVVDAWIIGNVAVHHPYSATEYGMKRWELTHVPTGKRIIGDTVKKLGNARRIASIFNRAFGTITKEEELIHNERAKRVYYAMRAAVYKHNL